MQQLMTSGGPRWPIQGRLRQAQRAWNVVFAEPLLFVDLSPRRGVAQEIGHSSWNVAVTRVQSLNCTRDRTGNQCCGGSDSVTCSWCPIIRNETINAVLQHLKR